jgi:hypothetical protein
MAKKTSKKKKQQMTRSQKIMAVVGVLIAIAMLLPAILSLFQ